MTKPRTSPHDRPEAPYLPRRRPRPLSLNARSLVRVSQLADGHELPRLVSPEMEMVNLPRWIGSNDTYVSTALGQWGGLLFRGFAVESPEAFESCVQALGNTLPYSERSSPRTAVVGNVYTSTDHPREHAIFLHNEQSYNSSFPLRICFCCLRPAETGGQTPIADCRRIFRRLPHRIIDAFGSGYLYARHFREGLGVSWQDAFQTHDKKVVENYCRQNDISLTWDGDCLKTSQLRRAYGRHPMTGEWVWFNHLTFFNTKTLPQDVRDLVQRECGEDPPHETYHADGRPIDEDTLGVIRRAYESECRTFEWRSGDVLLLDNMLVAHGRQAYTGPRQVVVAMSEPCSWEAIASI